MLRIKSLAIALSMTIATPAASPALDQEGVLLTIVSEQRPSGAHLTRDHLEALEQRIVATSTEWTDGVVRFEGPLARDVLDAYGIGGETVLAVAANDYMVEVPVSDFRSYDVVLALRMNGAPLTLRDKGPIWIVYPRDQHPELMDPAMNTRWVWQLTALRVR